MSDNTEICNLQDIARVPDCILAGLRSEKFNLDPSPYSVVRTCCAYRVAPLFFFTLTLLCPYSAFRFTTYPAVTLFFFSHLPCCAIIFLHTYPAVTYFFFARTLLCPYFRLPCCALVLRTE